MLIPCSYTVRVTDDRHGGTRGLSCSTPTRLQTERAGASAQTERSIKAVKTNLSIIEVATAGDALASYVDNKTMCIILQLKAEDNTQL